MNPDNLIVGNIQKTCFHDGPGIRTTVFLKGCPIRCPWCANPENLSLDIKYLVDKDKCNFSQCPYGLQCNGGFSSQEILHKNLNLCPKKAISKTGYMISITDLYNELTKINNHDGITFSGGDPLFQCDALINLLRLLKKDCIDICIETSLFQKCNIEDLVKYVDHFIIDVKILKRESALDILKGNIDNFYRNIDYLFNHTNDIVIRIPVSEEYIYNPQNINLILDLLKKYRPCKVEIFKLHNLAEKKYESLGLKYSYNKKISDEKINLLDEKIRQIGIECNIITF